MAAAALVLLAAAVRLPGLDGAPDDWDGIDFILGMEEFDLARFQPHFPGYPVYLAAAKPLVLLGLPPAWALETLGLLAGASLPLVVVAALRPSLPERWAWGAAALTALQPALALHSTRISSDVFGLLLMTLGILFLRRGRPAAGGLVMGLALGARLSYFPFTVFLFFPRCAPGRAPPFARAALGFLAGTLLWLAPLLSMAGGDLLREGIPFVKGHLLDWGGTTFAGGGAGTPGRSALWLKAFAASLAGGGGQPGPGGMAGAAAGGLVALGFIALAWRAERPERIRLAAAGLLLLPYAAWILIGQNPRHERHLLPLVFVAPSAAAMGFRKIRGGAWAGFFLGALWLIMTMLALAALRAAPPPGQALAAYLDALEVSQGDAIYCGESYRFLEWRRLDLRATIERARDFPAVVQGVNSQLVVPRRIFVTSEVERLPSSARPLKAFERPGLCGRERLEVYLFRTSMRGAEVDVLAAEPGTEGG